MLSLAAPSVRGLTGSGRTRTGGGRDTATLHYTQQLTLKNSFHLREKLDLWCLISQMYLRHFVHSFITLHQWGKNTAALQCWEEMKLEGKLIISPQMKSDESECSSIVIQTGLLWANTVLSYGMHNKHLYPLGECSHQCSCAVLW